MGDYKRVISYIYSYPGGVKDKNVGFAKVEVRNGMLKLAVNLRGIYTDVPEVFGIYFCVDRNKYERGASTMLLVGNTIVRCGAGHYEDVMNSCNINGTGYEFADISGIAVARESDRFYMMFSLWDDECFDVQKVRFVGKDYKKISVYDESDICECDEVNEPCGENECDEESKPCGERECDGENEPCGEKESEEKISPLEALFCDCIYINVFDDDYYYDCIEVSPEQLRKIPVCVDILNNNSFLAHGFFNFRHLLFGRVAKNNSRTEYFVGVPGMYCNRERYVAGMFGFTNFKKSHRSDYTNPYFGYWCQEI